MKTLAVYDDTGRVLVQFHGVVEPPVGVQYIEFELPVGKYLMSVDVSGEVHAPVLGDLPKSDTDILNDRLVLLEAALDDLILGGDK